MPLESQQRTVFNDQGSIFRSPFEIHPSALATLANSHGMRIVQSHAVLESQQRTIFRGSNVMRAIKWGRNGHVAKDFDQENSDLALKIERSVC
eukprot:3437933-Amphidinium_carterae.1